MNNQIPLGFIRNDELFRLMEAMVSSPNFEDWTQYDVVKHIAIVRGIPLPQLSSDPRPIIVEAEVKRIGGGND